MGRGGWVYLGYLINLQHQWIHNLPIFRNWVLPFIHRVPPSNIMWWFACGIQAFITMLLKILRCRLFLILLSDSSPAKRECDLSRPKHRHLKLIQRYLTPPKECSTCWKKLLDFFSEGLWTLKWPKIMSFFLFIERMKDRKAYPLAPRKPLHTFRIVSYPNDLW